MMSSAVPILPRSNPVAFSIERGVAEHRSQRDRQGGEGYRRVAGLEEKDVEVKLANGVLAVKGEKKTETNDKDRRFSECYYGRFERRIPVDEVEEDKVGASFHNRILTVILPKSAKAQEKVKRIAITANKKDV